MKLVYVLPLLLVSVVGFVGYAEAYDGKIKIMVEDSNFIQGDVIHVPIYIGETQPDPNTSITISIIEAGTKNIVETQTFIPDW